MTPEPDRQAASAETDRVLTGEADALGAPRMGVPRHDLRPRRGGSTPAVWALLCGLGLAPLPVWAQSSQRPAPVVAPSPAPAADQDDEDEDADARYDGTIVRIDRDRLFFDIGDDRQLAVGQTLLVLRTIAAKHPVTGRSLVDYFPIGSLRVDGVGRVLSFGHADRGITWLVKVGDVVRYPPPPKAKPTPTVATRPASPAGATPTAAPNPAPGTPAKSVAALNTPPPPMAAPEADARRLFQSTLGRPLPERIRIIESFLIMHPDTPYRAELESELPLLRKTQESLTLGMEIRGRQQDSIDTTRRRSSEASGSLTPVASIAVPERLYQGDPLEIVVYVQNPQVLRFIWLYLKPDSARTYDRLALVPAGDGYYRLRLPDRYTRAGTLEYFVGFVNTAGQDYSLHGTAGQPTALVIDPPPAPPMSPGPDHSAVSGFFEFVDFNRFRGNDYFFKAEADFMYRIGGILYSVRTGFGLLSGVGESVRNLDDLGMAPRPVGINYGYVEGELRFHRLVGLAARALAGQTQTGAGAGAELKLRIGSELGTNLIIGGAIISDFGGLAQLQLEWNVIRNWPMSVLVVATNQPVQTDLGVRLVYQVGWRLRRWFAPTARIGYDFRNINHGGLSLGMGIVMGW